MKGNKTEVANHTVGLLDKSKGSKVVNNRFKEIMDI